jgi:hypothetical protein
LQKDFEKSLSTNMEKMDKVFAWTFGTTKLKKKSTRHEITEDGWERGKATGSHHLRAFIHRKVRNKRTTANSTLRTHQSLQILGVWCVTYLKLTCGHKAKNQPHRTPWTYRKLTRPIWTTRSSFLFLWFFIYPFGNIHDQAQDMIV